MASVFPLVDDDERMTSGLSKESPDGLPVGHALSGPDAGPDERAGMVSHDAHAGDAVSATMIAVETGSEDLAGGDRGIVGQDDVIDDDTDEIADDDGDVVKAPVAAAAKSFTMKRPGMDDHRRLPDRLTPMPRPMADEEDFAEGDHVVYPTHGVGKVERIAVEDIAGHRLELIHITFEENRMKLRVPVAKARSAGLRKLATRKIFDEALAVLKGRARIKRTMWSRRAQEYEAKINSGDPMAIAEVVRDLHRNSGQPDQSFSERQIYEAAMDRLAAELAALDSTDKATAAVKLAQFLKTLTASGG